MALATSYLTLTWLSSKWSGVADMDAPALLALLTKSGSERETRWSGKGVQEISANGNGPKGRSES